MTEPDAYAEGAGSWSAHLEADAISAQTLLNAASYFMVKDFDASERISLRGLDAYPSESRFPESLAQLCQLRDPPQSARALSLYERALSITTGEEKRFYPLGNVAETALAAGDMKKARAYAEELLALAAHIDDWNTGNAIFTGNMVLGQIAVKEKDLDAACDLLVISATIAGSPQLDSFGPDMSLALELLKLGRRDPVLAFLDRCRTFWDKPELTRWRKDIVNGGIPDFGSHALHSSAP